MDATVPHGKLYLSCKKEGCNGVLCVSKSSRHGAAFQCSRCLNKQKYCQDCQQLYINFRRHRQLGHELYEFQRKRQVSPPAVWAQMGRRHGPPCRGGSWRAAPS
jgi:hypothetical protein